MSHFKTVALMSHLINYRPNPFIIGAGFLLITLTLKCLKKIRLLITGPLMPWKVTGLIISLCIAMQTSQSLVKSNILVMLVVKPTMLVVKPTKLMDLFMAMKTSRSLVEKPTEASFTDVECEDRGLKKARGELKWFP